MAVLVLPAGEAADLGGRPNEAKVFAGNRLAFYWITQKDRDRTEATIQWRLREPVGSLEQEAARLNPLLEQGAEVQKTKFYGGLIIDEPPKSGQDRENAWTLANKIALVGSVAAVVAAVAAVLTIPTVSEPLSKLLSNDKATAQPVGPPQGVQPASVAHSPNRPYRGTVLVVMDNVHLAKMDTARKPLEDLGLHFDFVSTNEDAVLRFRDHDYLAIVSDRVRFGKEAKNPGTRLAADLKGVKSTLPPLFFLLGKVDPGSRGEFTDSTDGARYRVTVNPGDIRDWIEAIAEKQSAR
jgi:hypothetical protein